MNIELEGFAPIGEGLYSFDVGAGGGEGSAPSTTTGLRAFRRRRQRSIAATDK